ncbi:MAG: hypothetical protein Q7Q71_15315 [Verrucomicrobiota bacterium JB023]|nr:hypothetical protein [Verrucomicrobiota bacterium JB023]
MNSNRSNKNRGFALVVTISLLVLLAMLSVGLLSLSSLSLRGSDAIQGAALARSNARLSLQMALAQLQTFAGPDTRVTAPASAVAGVNGPRQLTGVWRSWEGDDHDDDGLPIAPDYGAKLAQGSLGENSSGKFLGWLVSGEDGEAPANSPPDLTEGADGVPLLSSGSLGSQSNLEVHVTPTELIAENGTVGSYAWWVQGENTKVRLNQTEEAANNDEALDQMLVSPGPSGSEFDLDDTSDISRAITHDTLNLLGGGQASENAVAQEYYHDLTVYSQGLLTNTANGGWRRDLSLLAETWSDVENGFPSFTTRPGEVITAGKSNRSGSSANNPLIYPWTRWTGGDFPSAVSWSALVDFATQYRHIRNSGDEVVLMMEETDPDKNHWIDSVKRMPVLARVHYVVSLASELENGKYQPSIILNPVITMWNPYSVALDLRRIPNFSVQLQLGSPIEISLKCGSKVETVNLRDFGNERWIIPAGGSADTVWLPGEVRTYSPTGSAEVIKGSNTLTFKPGYSPSGGARYPVNQFEPQIGYVPYSAVAATNSLDLNLPNVKGSGIYFNHKRLASGNQWSAPKTTNVQCALDIAAAQRMLGKDVSLTLVTDSLSRLAGKTPEPFLTIVSSLRFGRDVNSNQNNIVVNGIHNMNPIVGFMVNGSDATDATVLEGRFDCFPYNVQYFPVNGANSPGMPSGLANDPEGYLGGGFSFNDGLSNLVLLEVPTRPLRTIGGLQHFNVNASNPWAPYTLNALGNSTTSPFLRSDRVQLTPPRGVTANAIGHDHSYCFNHVMLDDWFVSSVAPDMAPFSSSEERGVEQVYADHLSGEEPLPHHYYQPAEPSSNADQEASDFLDDPEAWQKIAAHLVVDGMFNINSTSEEAWAMLLKRSFYPEESAYLTLENAVAGSGGGSASLVQSDGSIFPRTALSSDPAGGASGFSFLGQPQSFNEQQINALAREIVLEIQERGPFLSLSEFFNRQLSDDPSLARAGAVESALSRLARGAGGGGNPYSDLVKIFSDEASSTDMQGNTLSYPFPEAAEGNPAYGFPGWTRQADVLRPISGVLSARDDTFIIRAYGDVRDPRTNRIINQAWCEATVQRTADYVDSSETSGDDKYVLPSEDTLRSEANQRFGRRFKMIRFRWLSPDEV